MVRATLGIALVGSVLLFLPAAFLGIMATDPGTLGDFVIGLLIMASPGILCVGTIGVWTYLERHPSSYPRIAPPIIIGWIALAIYLGPGGIGEVVRVIGYWLRWFH
jgi:hypothetical protein